MGLLLACVGALGVVTVARSQTVPPRLGTPPLARDDLPRATAPTLSDAPDGQRPVFLYPSATDSALGTEKFGLGPTAVVLKQAHGWTYGMLVNHIWSVAGNGSRDDVSSTFMQPFLTYTTKTFTTLGINTETTYDWEHHQGTVPLNWYVQQLLKVGTLPIAVQLGVRYYAEKPDGGPDWGLVSRRRSCFRNNARPLGCGLGMVRRYGP
jgi:hypothetical protein